MNENSKSFPFTQEELKELIDYDPETGVCRWKVRDIKWFAHNRPSKRQSILSICNQWNSKHAGNEIRGVTNENIKPDSYYIFSTKRANTGKFMCSLHRVIWFYMTGEWPNIVDHINGNRLDNSWNNLRNVDTEINAKNQKLAKNNTSGVSGVTFKSTKNIWEANIFHNKKRKHLGCFQNFDEAVAARKAAEIEFGYHENHGRVMK